jgi:hypothetical protein
MSYKKSIIQLFIINLLALNFSYAKVPSSWVDLPEESHFNKSMDQSDHNLEQPGEDNDIKGSILEIVNFNNQILRQVSPDITTSSNKGWQVDGLKTSIGITSSYLLGLISVKGTPVIMLNWKRASNKEKETKKSEDELVVDIGPELSDDDLKSMIRPVQEVITNLGIAKNNKKLKRNFLKAARQFQKMTLAMQGHQSHWSPSKLKLAISFDASGNIGFGKSGGKVKVFFNYKRKKINQRAYSLKNISKANKFIALLGHDLDQLIKTRAKEGRSDYKIDAFSFGLKMEASGSIVLAKSKAQIMGYMTFKKRERDPHHKLIVSNERSYLTVSDHLDEKKLDYAINKGIKFDIKTTEEDKNSVIYKIPREKFKEGLNKALSMANFFEKVVTEIPLNNLGWYIDSFMASFDLSLSGALYFVKVGGAGTVKVLFKRVKQPLALVEKREVEKDLRINLEEPSHFKEELKKELIKFNYVTTQLEVNDRKGNWFLETFGLGLYGYSSVEIPLLFSLKIQPFIKFHFSN